MNDQPEPFYIALTGDKVTEADLVWLNQLTYELGQALANDQENVRAVEYQTAGTLPRDTKTPELVFAQQAIITLIPIVTPWILSRIDKAVKSFSRAGNDVFAKVRAGNREIVITPKTTPSELASAIQNVKISEKLAPSKRYALIIGNSQYHDENLENLQSPTLDAERLAKVLLAPSIGAFTDVKELIDENSQTIKQAIETMFHQTREKEDLLLLYFSGHGIKSKSGQLYLAAKNTMRDIVRSTGISARFIKEIMDESVSQRQILILDCCFGGAIVEGAKSGAVLGQPVNSTSAFQTAGFGRVIITASESMQYAFDGQHIEGQLQNSIFTHHLIEGLKTGKADEDSDGLIDIDELYQYAYRYVIPKQNPNISTTSKQGKLYIALNPNPKIQPAKLPDYVFQGIKSEDRLVRQGTISELSRLLNSEDPTVILAAENGLKQMLSDDSKIVAQQAQSALNDHNQGHVVREEIQKPKLSEKPKAIVITKTPEQKSDISESEIVGESKINETALSRPAKVKKQQQEETDDLYYPPTALKWNWGAFWLTFIWGMKYKSKFTLWFLFPILVPIPQLIVGIQSGRKGGRWAWENYSQSEENFKTEHKSWNVLGFLFGWIVWLVVFSFGFMCYGIMFS